MTDIDPLSRIGLIIGMIIALFIGAPETYDAYTEPTRMDTTRQELELARGSIQIVRPQHPRQETITQIERFVCAYSSPWCGKDYVRILVDVADLYFFDPYVLVAIGIWESGLGRAGSHGCHFGYSSCRTRFTRFNEELDQVVGTLNRYGGSEVQKLAVWHTGQKNDNSGYVERVLATARAIEGR